MGVIIHVGSNDLTPHIKNIAFQHITCRSSDLETIVRSGMKEVISNIHAIIDCMMKRGYKRFMVCEMPVSKNMPIINYLQRYQALGGLIDVSLMGLSDIEMIQNIVRESFANFMEKYVGSSDVILFQEIPIVEASTDEWIDKVHPSKETHKRLGSEAAKLIRKTWPDLARNLSM